MESTEWGDTGSICTQWVKNTFRIRPMSKWVTLWSHHLIIVDLNSRVAKFSKISFDVKKFFFFFLLRKNSIYFPASAVCCFCFDGKERKKKAKSYSSKINRQVFNLLCHFKMKNSLPLFSVLNNGREIERGRERGRERERERERKKSNSSFNVIWTKLKKSLGSFGASFHGGAKFEI